MLAVAKERLNAPQKPSRLRQSSSQAAPLRLALPCNSGKIQCKRLLYSFVQQPFWQVDDLKWPPRCYGHLQRKAYLYFALSRPVGRSKRIFTRRVAMESGI